ncbi:hypothetical protein GYMLUDRAFT_943199 [Collybiopsis luxurians FD-317 M1]|uniref:Unplaced genomic scaffold GYMLUscaffold_84, whole genome shotgun sequence n=1 Tax=Collybiopsis luxurians FD-317 M1 TaxID=944289 RepID=A0A0D0C5R3_9AGAR|nr:hypothetical protein GYMLUDRAFT_943199 [Collybiopsis luxurians FD-317 M1]
MVGVSNHNEGSFAPQQEDIHALKSDSAPEESATVTQRGPSTQYCCQRTPKPPLATSSISSLIANTNPLNPVKPSNPPKAAQREPIENSPSITRFQSLNEDQVMAERKLEGELTSYKTQYDLALKEIKTSREEVMALQAHVQRTRLDPTKSWRYGKRGAPLPGLLYRYTKTKYFLTLAGHNPYHPTT